MPQRTFQRRLHLHLPKLGDREVQVLGRRLALVRVVLQQQLGEVEAYERNLRPKAHLLANGEALGVVAARRLRLADEKGCGADLTADANEVVLPS